MIIGRQPEQKELLEAANSEYSRFVAVYAQIKAALGISGVLSNVYSWRTEANEDKGIDKTQIDLLIDRNDGVINLREMKCRCLTA